MSTVEPFILEYIESSDSYLAYGEFVKVYVEGKTYQEVKERAVAEVLDYYETVNMKPATEIHFTIANEDGSEEIKIVEL